MNYRLLKYLVTTKDIIHQLFVNLYLMLCILVDNILKFTLHNFNFNFVNQTFLMSLKISGFSRNNFIYPQDIPIVIILKNRRNDTGLDAKHLICKRITESRFMKLTQLTIVIFNGSIC